MPRKFSRSFKSNISTMSGKSHPIILLEINHPTLSTPVRLNSSGADLASEGNNYIACPFKLVLPDDTEGNLPRATLELTNIGRSLSYWIDQTMGAKDAEVIIKIVQKDNPDFVEYQICTDVSNLSMNITQISAQLTFDDLINKLAVPIIYNYETAPGLY